ncbi:trehalose-phosphatase [Thermodesulfovibrio yellowstonii]|uniref:trehalose-phosphatase n=1 Tax=Thermodesulfovibrio yellowstonii TaxID=28262 RepID=UPI0024B3C95C|nr:trehalose-phosphatase [Thermodesulfovibrio yellowstonii]MDI6864760.1 trehalose-phosphatase [Thermodesulfovibrio yellowstonii]
MPDYFFHSNWLDLINREKIFLFFDFDGTLVPIMKNPDDCYLSDNVRESLWNLKNKIKIAIISGRDLEDLKRRVCVDGIYYSGSHGLQIEGPDIEYYDSEAQRLKPNLDKIYTKVKELSDKFAGAFIEKKSFSFTLHYRQVEDKQRKELKNLFFEIIDSFGEKNIKVLNGKMVFEVLPAVDWNKGRAVSFMLNKFDEITLPIFFGDDLTDETVFKEIKDIGLSVKIGYSKNTIAKYFLKNQAEVYKFIKIIQKALNV